MQVLCALQRFALLAILKKRSLKILLNRAVCHAINFPEHPSKIKKRVYQKSCAKNMILKTSLSKCLQNLKNTYHVVWCCTDYTFSGILGFS